MTLIDQAVMKAFQRREQPTATPPRVSAAVPQALGQSERAGHMQIPATSAIGQRELFVHAPESLLKGMHRHAGSDAARAQRESPATDAMIEDDFEVETLADPAERAEASQPEADASQSVSSQTVSAVELVMNSLLSYELAIQGPSLEAWQIATESAELPGTDESFTKAISDSHPAAAPASPTSPAVSIAFKPAWETDSFRTSAMCRTIEAHLQDQLQRAAATLLDDCAGNRSVVNVTGGRRGQGRTTVSILLARALAKAGLRAILVDGDFANPDLGDHLGVAVEAGWNTHLDTPADMAECCVHSLADGFSLLALDPLDRHDAEAATTGLPKLLRFLASHFDVVLVDAGRVSTEQIEWPRELLGAHVVVLDLRDEDPSTFEPTLAQLENGGQTVIRVVENFA